VRHMRGDVVRPGKHGTQEHEVRVSVSQAGKKELPAQIDRPGVSKGRGLRSWPRPNDAIRVDVHLVVASWLGGAGVDRIGAAEPKTLRGH